MKVTLSGLYETKSIDFINPTGGLIELFQIAHDLGFDGVDYMSTIPDMFFKPNHVLELSKKYTVPILGIHAPLHLLFFTPPFFFQSLAHMFHYFPQAEVFNFHLSCFITPVIKNDMILNKFLTLVKEKKLPVSFESNPLLIGLGRYPNITYEPELFAQYCIDHNLSITFDTAHVAHCNYDIVKFFRKYHHHIKLIHLSDSIGALQHLPLGKGNLPIKELLQEMKKLSYNKMVTFEIAHFLPKTTTQQKTEDIQNSFSMLKQYAM